MPIRPVASPPSVARWLWKLGVCAASVLVGPKVCIAPSVHHNFRLCRGELRRGSSRRGTQIGNALFWFQHGMADACIFASAPHHESHNSTPPVRVCAKTVRTRGHAKPSLLSVVQPSSRLAALGCVTSWHPQSISVPIAGMVRMLVWDKRGETRLWRVRLFMRCTGADKADTKRYTRVGSPTPIPGACGMLTIAHHPPGRLVCRSDSRRQRMERQRKTSTTDARLGNSDMLPALACQPTSPARQLSGRLHLRVPVRACMSRQTLPR